MAALRPPVRPMLARLARELPRGDFLYERGDEVDVPTAVVFDLDPGPPARLAECRRVALALRARLEELGLASLPKLTGSIGLHVVVPLNGAVSFEATKAFARRVADELAASLPELVVASPARTTRAGKVFVDWMQNTAARSLVAPYSLRALPYPTVAAPVSWEEVEHGPDEALVFAPRDVVERIERCGDLHRPALGLVQRLP